MRHTQATAQSDSSSNLAKISLRTKVSGRGKASLGGKAPPLSSAATASATSRGLLVQVFMSHCEELLPYLHNLSSSTK